MYIRETSARSLWLGLIVVLVLVTGCGKQPVVQPQSVEEPEFAYTVGECRDDIPPAKLQSWAKFDVGVEDGVVVVNQYIDYVCCAEIDAELQVEGRVIKIVETNVGQVCRCLCGYELHAEISNLPAGTYTVQVWGVQYQEDHPLEQLGEAQITL